ncbi:MAG: tetratricopeptide repeat protein [Planctomycetota bacterium]
MSRTHKTGLAPLALLLGVALLPAGLPAQDKAAPDDRITTADGKILRRVEVLSETLTEVKYKKGGKEESMPYADVLDVEYTPAPDSYLRGVAALERGDLATAANLFQDAASGADRPALGAHAGFRAVKTLVAAAAQDPTQASIAAQAAATWLAANAEHRQAPEAHRLHGQALLLAGEGAKALAAFQALEDLARTKNLKQVWIARARFGIAEAQVRAKEFQKAREAYQGAAATLRAMDLSSDIEAARLAVAAEVGVGETFMEDGHADEALRYFQGLEMKASNDADLRNAAVCGRSAALCEVGAASKDLDKLRAAQEGLARVSATDVLDGDSSVKALYYLGRCLLALGDHEPDGARRARRYFELVVQSYPGNRWAAYAQKELQ